MSDLWDRMVDAAEGMRAGGVLAVYIALVVVPWVAVIVVALLIRACVR